MFYGDINSSEFLVEQTILNEMHISKKDLYNPNILNKVLDRSKKEASNTIKGTIYASFLLGLAADVLVGVITKSAFYAIGLFFPFIGGACSFAYKVVMNMPDYEKKNLGKLEAKAKKVKAKAEKLKDSPDKTKIIAACDKVLKAINDYNQKKIDAAKEKVYKEAKSIINRLIKAANGESFPNDYLPDVYTDYKIADSIGLISTTELDKIYSEFCMNNPDEEGVLELITNSDTYEDAVKHSGYSSEDLEELASNIAGFKENTKICDIGRYDDGESFFFFNLKDKKFYYYSYNDIDKESSLYALSAKFSSHSRKLSKDDIKMYKEVYEELTTKTEDIEVE